MKSRRGRCEGCSVTCHEKKMYEYRFCVICATGQCYAFVIVSQMRGIFQYVDCPLPLARVEGNVDTVHDK
jgi:hypothetical protein